MRVCNVSAKSQATLSITHSPLHVCLVYQGMWALAEIDFFLTLSYFIKTMQNVLQYASPTYVDYIHTLFFMVNSLNYDFLTVCYIVPWFQIASYRNRNMIELAVIFYA